MTSPQSAVHPSLQETKHIFVILGPAGCGKSTTAQHLAQTLSWPSIEGDDFHSRENKEKMGNGVPLTDADRWDWLITLRDEAMQRLDSSNSVIMTCSALKRKYRDVIRIANYENPTVKVHFIYLKLDEGTLQERVANRPGHYMKSDMVHSQMETLEEPKGENDVITVDVTNNVGVVQRDALAKVIEAIEL